jgi:protein-S-isoprenylcysteine O-methyltransferase Ste14
METNTILLIALVGCLVLNNYVGLYISRRYGTKIPGWSSIIKSRDYTFYLIYASYLLLLVSAIISIIKDRYRFPLALAGFFLILLSMYINFIARRDLARYWTPLADTEKEQVLIKSGIYGRVRHPIYLSILIQLIGLALVGGNFYGFLFFILSVVALALRIKKEEQKLVIKFGEDYKEYAARTPALLPGLRKK